MRWWLCWFDLRKRIEVCGMCRVSWYNDLSRRNILWLRYSLRWNSVRRNYTTWTDRLIRRRCNRKKVKRRLVAWGSRGRRYWCFMRFLCWNVMSETEKVCRSFRIALRGNMIKVGWVLSNWRLSEELFDRNWIWVSRGDVSWHWHSTMICL
jgi:hypothetical protein